MRTQPDRRQNHSGPHVGMPERRSDANRRTLNVTAQSLVQVEARLAALTRSRKAESEEDDSGWDKLIIPLD